MECFLLGSGGMMPMPRRLLTSLAVRVQGRTYLFDAGEGTQIGWKQMRIGLRGLCLVAVSHLHADHCLGLPGMLMLRSQMAEPGPLTILGPPGIERFVVETRELLGYHVGFPIRFIEWHDKHPGPAYSDEQVRIFWEPLKHTRFCLGYRLEELERPGRFLAEKAAALGVPPGPLRGRLQHGESVTLEDGRTVAPEDVLGPPRRGRHLAYVVDTLAAKGVYRLCRDADIAFIEGMFLPEDAEHAEAKGHLTVAEAGRIAGRAGVRRAVLVHISPRYDNDQLEQLEAAARQRFPEAEMGRDTQIYQVPLPEDDT